MENRPSSEGPTAPMSPTPAKASVFEDVVDSFYAPSSVFMRRANSGFGMYLLLVTLIAAVFAFANRGIMMQVFEGEFDRRIAEAVAKNPQAAAAMEQAQAMKGVQLKIQGYAMYVATPLMIFFVAFGLWLVAMIFKARVTYGQAVLIVAIAFIPRQLGSLVTTIQVLVTDTSALTNPYALALSPAKFMDRDMANSKLYAFLSSLEVFRIWCAVVQGIGISIIAKVPASKGYLAAGTLFGVFSLLALAFG